MEELKNLKIHFINAGAGSGKTTELIRILTEKLSTDGIEPSEFILTTYTNAAAGEFRDRALKSLLGGNAKARDAASKLDTAMIGTVHSVANAYLERYWYDIGYSGRFNIMSNAAKERYINTSLSKFIPGRIADLRAYEEKFKLLKRDGDRYVENSDWWKVDAKKIIEKMQSYNIDPASLPAFRDESIRLAGLLYCHDFSRDGFITASAGLVQTINNTIAENLKPNKQGKVAPTKKEKADRLTAFKARLEAFGSVSIPSDEDLKEISDEIKKIDKDDPVLDYLQLCLFNTANGQLVAKCIGHVFDIAMEWSQDYAQYKRQNNLVDFSDMESLFLKLLDRPEVQDDIRSNIRYLFVDEFQDSNPIQLEIFKKLAALVSEQTYWVGDPKQAIYGFRGSDTSLTSRVISMFPEVPADADSSTVISTADSSLTSQRLSVSHRSVKTLVELSNGIFDDAFKNLKAEDERIMSGVKLTPEREDGNVPAPVIHWESKDGGWEQLANAICAILNKEDEMVTGCYEKGPDGKPVWRDITDRDIAVLTRNNSDCSAIEKALRAHGIQVSSPETDLRDKAEVRLVLTLLKYIDFIDWRLTRAELSRLLYDNSLDDVMKVAPLDLNLDDVERLRDLRGRSVSEALTDMFARLDIYNLVAKWGDVGARRMNLNRIVVVAHEYEAECASSVQAATFAGFIEFFNRYEFETELDPTEDGVKVATYHKSKGLQWPVVILTSLGKDSLTMEYHHPSKGLLERQWFNVNSCGGYGDCSLTYIPNSYTVGGAVAEAIKKISMDKEDGGLYERILGKAQAEETRLLYVGLTRAQDYAITYSDGNYTWVNAVLVPKDENEITDEADDFDPVWGVRVDEGKSVSICVDDLPETVRQSDGAQSRMLDNDLRKGFVPSKTLKKITPSKKETNATKYDCHVSQESPLEVTDYLEHGNVSESDAFGTCIHDYFAAFRWNGSGAVEQNHGWNAELARKVVERHSMEDVIKNPEQMATTAETFFIWLTRRYGEGCPLREVPFTYRHADGQVASGEIDLVWDLDRDGNGKRSAVLVDYKNFSARKEFGRNAITHESGDAGNPCYVGKYFSQLGEYRAALTAAGYSVKEVLVFYSVLGLAVGLEY